VKGIRVIKYCPIPIAIGALKGNKCCSMILKFNKLYAPKVPPTGGFRGAVFTI
jgi:hypothetical protein